MEAQGTLSVQCKCGKQHPFEAEEADFDKLSSDSGNTEYKWYIDFNCSRCGKSIVIDYSVFESPKGKLSKQNVKVGGAELKEEYGFKF